MRYLVALVAGVVFGGVFGVGGAVVIPVVEPDPAVLLRASFDKDINFADFAFGQKEFMPNLRDRSWGPRHSSWNDWQIEKDLGLYRAKQGVDGVSGGYLSVPLGKGHRFRALGNVNMHRGTVSFWYRNVRKPSDAHASLIEIPASGMFMRARKGRIFFHFGSYGESRFRLPEQAEEVGVWQHIALVYDARFGFRFYFNGELMRFSKWDEASGFYFADNRTPDLIALGCGDYYGATLPFDFDELVVFSEALSSDAVRDLSELRSMRREGAFEPRPSEDIRRSHRLAELGWTDDSGYPEWSSSAPLLLREVGVESSRAVKAWRVGAVDGVGSTTWPLQYQGYRIAEQGLHLELEKGAVVDHMVVHGDFAGGLFKGDAIEKRGNEHVLDIEVAERVLRVGFADPLEAEKLSFFRKSAADAGASSGGAINEVSFFRRLVESDSIYGATPRPVAFTAESYEPDSSWVRWKLSSEFESEDRVSLRFGDYHVDGPGGVRLKALRHAHFFLQPSESDLALAGLGLRLNIRNPGKPFRMRVQVRDPGDPARVMFSLDSRLYPESGEEIARFEALLDMQDVIVPAGKELWVTLTPEEDVDLLWDGKAGNSFAVLLERPREEVKTEHVRNLLAFARDRFIHVSEQRPWRRMLMEICGERLWRFRRLDLALQELHRVAPEDEKVNALWIWTHPHNITDYRRPAPPSEGDAPKWAVYARETMRLVHEFVYWWIDNRQLPNGLFGSGHGDDTDLVQDWPNPGLAYDPEGRIADSLRRISDYCWSEGPMRDGINTAVRDTLHAYEEGVNTQPLQALMYYGNPVYLERLMETSRTVRDYLTYETEDGKRFFKANYYGAEGIRTEYEAGRDFPGNALLMHPALYLAYYSRNPGAMRLLEEWVGTWAGLLSEKWRRNGAHGAVPFYAAYPDGKVVESGGERGVWYGFPGTLLGMHEMTGLDKYYEAFQVWVGKGSFPPAFNIDWRASRDMSELDKESLESAGTIDWSDLDPIMGDDVRSARAYLGWMITGDKGLVEKACEEMWNRIAVLFPMHTWSEQSADRVAVSAEMVSRLYLGGTPGKRNKLWPTHTVSWEGMDEDFAAWVLETTARSLKVWVYNFKPRVAKGIMRVWGLEEGEYELRGGVNEGESAVLESAQWVRRERLSRNSPVALELPANALTLVEINQVSKGASLFRRPDLAVVNTDMEYDAERKLLKYTIHNAGSLPASDVEVLVEADGVRLGGHVISLLESPDDLEPRTATFEQVTEGAREIRITVDPENRISEIWKGNNTASFIVPPAKP